MSSLASGIGDITEDDADLLVCTVNCHGVMGKGVARSFRDAFPHIVKPYQKDCAQGHIIPGGCLIYDLPDQPGRRWAALATKDHWRFKSNLLWVKTGLKTLEDLAKAAGVTSIAIPRPGCGNGGLDWGHVEPLVMRYLGDFDLRIYGNRPVPEVKIDRLKASREALKAQTARFKG